MSGIRSSSQELDSSGEGGGRRGRGSEGGKDGREGGREGRRVWFKKCVAPVVTFFIFTFRVCVLFLN